MSDQPKPKPNGRFALPAKSLIPARYAEPGTSGLTLDVKSGEKNEATFLLEDDDRPEITGRDTRIEFDGTRHALPDEETNEEAFC